MQPGQEAAELGGVYEGDPDQHRLSSSDLSRRKKKSIGEKLSFLNWKGPGGGGGAGSEIFASGASSSSVRPTRDQVVRWGSSFDSLLNDKYGLALFRAFLKTEYSDENIEFWVACEEFRALVGHKKQAAKAQKIYNEFVAFQAPREVNLDSTTRLTTINSMGSIDKHLFEQAQKRIQALMEKDSYQRFLRSEVYLSHLNSASAASNRSSGFK
uniref:RGS domain-containing protein n=1 Tax=Macrostomum lignano TaxID=282301 RepID=A0A1I8H3A2_9PLAT